MNEAYFKREFRSALDADYIFEQLRVIGQPVPIRELAESIIRRLLEIGETSKGVRVYSPEQSYKPGEKIFILLEDLVFLQKSFVRGV